MFCGTCGTRNPDINKFCRQCGTKLPERAQTLSEDQFADLQAPEPPAPVDNAKVAVLMDVAFAYHRDGKADQAIQTCQEAIALNAESTSAHSLLAVLYEEKGQLDEAVTHQRRVLELNPDSVADKENLARLLGENLAKPAPRASVVSRIPRSSYPVLAGAAAALLVLMLVMVPVLRALRGADEREPRATARRSTTYDAGRTAAVSGPVQGAPAPTGPSPSLSASPAMAAPAPAAEPFERSVPNPMVPRRQYTPIPTEPSASSEEPLQPLPPAEAPQGEPAARLAPPVVVGGSAPAAPPRVAGPTAAPGATMPAAPAQPPSLEATFSTASQSAPAPRPVDTATRPQSDPSRSRVVIHVTDPGTREYEQWARQASASGNYSQAISHYQKALSGARTGTQRGRIHQQMGYAYQQMGKTADAESEYRNAIREYQQQASQGTNADLAQAGIRASEAGLHSLGL